MEEIKKEYERIKNVPDFVKLAIKEGSISVKPLSQIKIEYILTVYYLLGFNKMKTATALGISIRGLRGILDKAKRDGVILKRKVIDESIELLVSKESIEKIKDILKNDKLLSYSGFATNEERIEYYNLVGWGAKYKCR